ncbi:ABC transporter permease [Bifidobacterium vespertilionis]|uniref:FtsX-like permease family protein n=1 Tax=Bifidobacterium vespertilionis TaxID=2562524 RepID=A0A5J5DZ41_9BIFI|nr:ABC transporter permease [Bifidobacterium vespertilionis]KAA8822076.1 FtsX-like permease family protein [Bifidobacterium vespertilionis]KAA8824561.1 FtsX-like permease family protein [Bifidobacterium vespertilionis]
MATRRKTSHAAMWKDAWRAIRGNGKRFAAIAVICAVGVMMMGGLSSVSVDLKAGLDEFFDGQSMHDVSIVSTLGLDDDDITALRGVDSVADAAGVRSESATTKVDGRQASATVTALNDRGLDLPYLTDGRLPEAAHEIAVTRQYLANSGKALGDTLEFSPDAGATASAASSASSDSSDEDASDTFADGAYTIVGTVVDPNDIVNPDGPLALVSGTKTVYAMFVSADAVADGDAPYTSAVVTVSGAADLDTYGTDYDGLLAEAKSGIEAIESERTRARTETVRDDAIDAAMASLDSQRKAVDAMPDANPMKAAAKQKLADAEQAIRDKVNDAVPDAQWIVRDRAALTSYADVKTEGDMIGRLGKLFPILFLVIAILVSLTAVARMVEEDRQLIGTYKALGYTRGETMVKYLMYSLAACLAGGLLGDLLGLIGLPFVFTRRMLKILYVLPSYPLIINWTVGVGGVLLFVVLICGSAMAVCAKSLSLQPAELLRPKAPKAGRTTVFERIGFVWNHLSFLGKVTARNLFRYKSRALMVIVGVLGCTALMTAGFGMASSAFTLIPRQFDEISTYDVMAITKPADHDDAQRDLDADAAVSGTLPLHLESGTLSVASGSSSAGSSDGDGTKLTAQLMVVPDGESVDGYLNLHTADGTALSLDDSGAIVSASAAKTFGLANGGTVNLADAMMNAADVTVTGVAQYYTGNVVIMTETAWRTAFDVDADTDLAVNADLIKLDGDADARIAFADGLASQDRYLSVSSSDKQMRDFARSFMIFFVMIGFIVAMAAILAVVVLYTLASTNISERERELATIKVLGFRRREVHGYVNKEMLLLSAIGIALGLPSGRLLIGGLLSMLDLPGMNIVPNVAWYCYVIAAALAFLFTWLVSRATNRSLDRIDMVGALKSPE